MNCFLWLIQRISLALGDLNERVIFVGGATIGLYINDPRISLDFEDIVFLIDNRTDIVEQIDKAQNDVKPYLKEQLGLILNDNVLQEAILGNLAYDTHEARYGRIIQCIEQISTQD